MKEQEEKQKTEERRPFPALTCGEELSHSKQPAGTLDTWGLSGAMVKPQGKAQNWGGCRYNYGSLLGLNNTVFPNSNPVSLSATGVNKFRCTRSPVAGSPGWPDSMSRAPAWSRGTEQSPR